MPVADTVETEQVVNDTEAKGVIDSEAASAKQEIGIVAVEEFKEQQKEAIISLASQKKN